MFQVFSSDDDDDAILFQNDAHPVYLLRGFLFTPVTMMITFVPK